MEHIGFFLIILFFQAYGTEVTVQDEADRSSLEVRKSGKVFQPGSHLMKKGEKGSFASPGFGVRKYPKMMNISWSFESEDCQLSLKCLSVSISFSPACQEDYLYVTDNRKLNNRYCGSIVPPETLISNSGDFKIVFRSSDRTNADLGFACFVQCKGLNISASTATTATPVEKDLDCKCGNSLANTEGRVVGGTEVPIGKYPWMAGLVIKDVAKPFCGAALINDRYAVTAAHCLMRYQGPEDLDILIREHDYREDNEVFNLPRIRIPVAKFQMHPEFSKKKIDYDIALVKLSTPLVLDGPGLRSVVPICLPEQGNRILGRNLTVAGWGATSEGGKPSTFLRETGVSVIPHSQCRKAYGGIIGITERMLCAAWPNGEHDACQRGIVYTTAATPMNKREQNPIEFEQGLLDSASSQSSLDLYIRGDSGGPLVMKNEEGYYEQLGIVSFGFGCGRPEYPGIYTRLSNLLSWIRENTNDAQWCQKKQ